MSKGKKPARIRGRERDAGPKVRTIKVMSFPRVEGTMRVRTRWVREEAK